jgi:hypothetical protein
MLFDESFHVITWVLYQIYKLSQYFIINIRLFN